MQNLFFLHSFLQIRLIRTHPQADEFRYSYQESYNVYRRYQMTIHKETEAEVSKAGYSDFLVKSPLEVLSSMLYCLCLHELSKTESC